jgi:hypothetical protein
LRHVASKIEYTLVVRVYDDGIAFRYVVPGTGSRAINGEATRYPLPAHGCNKPTGLEYTWPHEMSREGIRGMEFGPAPSFDQRHPFGRLLAGHGDYSPF